MSATNVNPLSRSHFRTCPYFLKNNIFLPVYNTTEVIKVRDDTSNFINFDNFIGNRLQN